LIELEISPDNEEFDWDTVTQEDPSIHRNNWQAAFQETKLDDEGTRWAFYFHYLDVSRPLLTATGQLSIPATTPVPSHLQHLKYVSP